MMKNVVFVIILVTCFACAGQNEDKENKSVSPVREDIEWLDVWMPHTNDTLLPRVLYIGNSITRQYYPAVCEKLKDKAYGARLSTSKSLGDPALLDEIALVMKGTHWDIVHFNNGMHGDGYTEEQYKAAFPELLTTIRQYAPKAKLIWASTTPVRQYGNVAALDPKTERIRERNRIAAECLAGQPVIVNDLFSLMIDHPEYYGEDDGVHPKAEGVTVMAKQVAQVVSEVLNTLK